MEMDCSLEWCAVSGAGGARMLVGGTGVKEGDWVMESRYLP